MIAKVRRRWTSRSSVASDMEAQPLAQVFVQLDAEVYLPMERSQFRRERRKKTTAPTMGAATSAAERRPSIAFAGKVVISASGRMKVKTILSPKGNTFAGQRAASKIEVNR